MRFLWLIINAAKNNPLLTLIIIAGTLIRLALTTPGYYYPHGDELLFGEAINMIINKNLALKEQYLGYPPLVPWTMLVAFISVFLPFAWAKTLIFHFQEIYLLILFLLIIPALAILVLTKIMKLSKITALKTYFIACWILLAVSACLAIGTAGGSFQRDVLGLNWLNALYWGRYLTALIGGSVILLTYLVSLSLFNKKLLALLAATLVAFNYRLILSSHVGLPDMYNVFYLLIALLAISKLLQKSDFKHYLWTFISLAAFFIVKYQPHILVPFLITHIAVSLKGVRSSSHFLKNFFAKKVIISGLVGLFIILVSHIYHFQHWDKVLEINEYEGIKYGFGRNIFNIFPISYLYHIAIGPIISLMALGGLSLGLVKKGLRLKTLILVSFLPSFGFLYLYYTGGGFYTRNFISAIPLILILAAVFIYEIYQLIYSAKLSQSKILAYSFLSLALAFMLQGHISASLIAAKSYSSEAPLITSRKWVEQNIPENVIYGRYGGNPAPTNPKIEVANFLPYNQALSYQEMLKEKYDYVSIDFSYLRGALLWWTRQPTDIGLKFWDKPNDLIAQGYYALAFRELLWNHTVNLFSSPWQAPTHSYAIIHVNDKFYNLPSTDYKLIKQYNSFETEWTPLYFLDSDRNRLKQNQTLIITSGQNLPGSIRWQSNSFQVKANHAYKIIGVIKTDNEIPKEERDGFLRLDFYQHQPPVSITARPIISSVSERVYGQADSHIVSIDAIAPADSKYATLGFQADGHARSAFELISIEVSETINPVGSSVRHFTISDNDLFLPNDDGIL